MSKNAAGIKGRHIFEGHRTSVWNRIAEGSQQAECTCGWKGPKRTAIGGLAYTDADLHIDLSLPAVPSLGEHNNE